MVELVDTAVLRAAAYVKVRVLLGIQLNAPVAKLVETHQF